MRCPLIAVWLLVGLLSWCIAGWAQDRPRKKLVEYGWDVPYPDFVRDHIREMERRPFDGVIFRLEEFNHAFDARPWTEEQLAPQMEALRAIEWRSFTDNFLMLYAANRWGMDWFDDGQWDTIAANLRLHARAARAGGCVGVAWDPEPYGENPWAYPGIYGDQPPAFADLEAQVRRRGAQFITAMQEEMPGLRLLTLFQLSLFGGIAGEPDPERRREKLSHNHYGLLPAFLNGMLDAAAPDTVIIDGNEPSYYYTGPEPYFRAYHLMRQGALSLVAPENRRTYAARTQVGMALYMDQLLALRPPEGGFLCYFLEPAERLRWFEHNVYYALTSADEYVWCYSERMDWWGRSQGAEWHAFVPAGAEEAIRSARAKVAGGEPLGFDIREIIEQGQRAMDAALAARLVQREATLRRLATGGPAPEIDGRLDDPAWQTHPALEPFLPNANSAQERTDAPPMPGPPTTTTRSTSPSTARSPDSTLWRSWAPDATTTSGWATWWRCSSAWARRRVPIATSSSTLTTCNGMHGRMGRATTPTGAPPGAAPPTSARTPGPPSWRSPGTRWAARPRPAAAGAPTSAASVARCPNGAPGPPSSAASSSLNGSGSGGSSERE